MSDPIKLLTDTEHDLLAKLGECAVAFAGICSGGSYRGDYAEAADKIHQLQAMVMGQAAARAYPKRYRMLGRTP